MSNIVSIMKSYGTIFFLHSILCSFSNVTCYAKNILFLAVQKTGIHTNESYKHLKYDFVLACCDKQELWLKWINLNSFYLSRGYARCLPCRCDTLCKLAPVTGLILVAVIKFHCLPSWTCSGEIPKQVFWQESAHKCVFMSSHLITQLR